MAKLETVGYESISSSSSTEPSTTTRLPVDVPLQRGNPRLEVGRPQSSYPSAFSLSAIFLAGTGRPAWKLTFGICLRQNLVVILVEWGNL